MSGLRAAAFLNACSVHNVTKGMEDGERYDAVISVKGDAAKQESALAQQLKELRNMPGKTDEEAAVLYGGGAENRTADQRLLVGMRKKKAGSGSWKTA